jgi:choline dehydrogenase
MGMGLSTEGFNSGTLSGFGAWTTTLISPQYAERSSSTEFLKRAIENTDIMIYHHTQALKVNFNSQKKAVSVHVSTEGLEYTLSAAKEIIISAGAIHSPQLLMVSGELTSHLSRGR